MKQKMKFIVAVFGVTLAIFSSMTSSAKPVAARCSGTTTASCATLESGFKLYGDRT